MMTLNIKNEKASALVCPSLATALVVYMSLSPECSSQSSQLIIRYELFKQSKK